MDRLEPNLRQFVAARTPAGRRKRIAGGLMSFVNRATDLVAVDLRYSIPPRQIDQLMAGLDDVQPTQSHQRADNGLVFAKGKQLGTETGKGAFGMSDVLHSLIIFADLLRADRQLSVQAVSLSRKALPVPERRQQEPQPGRHTTACRAPISSTVQPGNCELALSLTDEWP